MSHTSETVLSHSTADGITIITINRPHRRNAVDVTTSQKLYEAIIAFENDVSQKVGILVGANGTFCAGADLHDLAQNGSSADANIHLQPVLGRNRGPMGPSRLRIKKPFLCAVAGHAVAGGLELSLLGDVRIAEEDAVFGVFCRRWGVPLIDGGTVRLQAIVGLGRALDMILTGRPVGAQEALSIGLANRVVPKGKALEAATAYVKELLKFPQLCMNLDRDATYYSAFDASSAEDALREEFERGIKVIDVESVKGAARFRNGAGRHGSCEKLSKL
jgi:enoyl-CoA hydratase/carnithine racemase